MKKIIILVVIFICSSLIAADKTQISIFYKEKPPSQKVLQKVRLLLEDFQDSNKINYYNIEDEKNAELINKLGLPSTHFPFAVVIDGKFTAEIDGKVVSFIHFPLFMKGIGRHEGNWSLDNLKRVLGNKDLLAEENVLPIIDEESETSDCEE